MTAKPDKSQTGSPAPTGPTDPTPGTFHPDIQSVPLLDRDIAEWVGRAHNRIVENAARCVGLSKRRITRDVVEQIFDDAICSLVEDEGVPLRAVLKARSEVMRGMSAVGAFRGSDLRPIQEINVDLLNMLAREDRITQFVADSAIGLADVAAAPWAARESSYRAPKRS